ncbi:MAG: hypothetical protein U9N44_00365 [Chloroflexota bacterium]|nr:hypothetical protein [Chloroflexota bacterium]
MARPKKAGTVPSKCAKCSSGEIERAELSMYGKLGFMGPDYRFDVYICTVCGFSELYFQGAKWIK